MEPAAQTLLTLSKLYRMSTLNHAISKRAIRYEEDRHSSHHQNCIVYSLSFLTRRKESGPGRFAGELKESKSRKSGFYSTAIEQIR